MIQTTFDAPDNDVVTIQCSYAWPSGWTMTLCTRPSGASGPSAWKSDRYEGLTADELMEAITASAWCALNPRSSTG